jgi:hypothetical protein
MAAGLWPSSRGDLLNQKSKGLILLVSFAFGAAPNTFQAPLQYRGATANKTAEFEERDFDRGGS